MESVFDIKVPTPAAIQARSVASAVVAWFQDPPNKTIFCAFAEDLTAELSMCITSSVAAHSRPHLRREHMWHQYHSLRISGTLRESGLSSSRPAPNSQLIHPSISMSVTIVFDELIKQKFPLQKKKHIPKDIAITNEQANVIRYTAGYTLRTVKKKL